MNSLKLPFIPVIALLLITCCFSSCVTLFNRKNTLVEIHAKRGTTLVYDCKNYSALYNGIFDKKIKTTCEGEYEIPRFGAKISVPRDSKKKLQITVKKDSMQKTISLAPNLCTAYYANFLNLGLGFLIDRNNPNRFGYPKHVYIGLGPTDTCYGNYSHPIISRTTKNITLNFSLLIGNGYYLNDGSNGYDNCLSLSYSAGINYWLSKKQFLSATIGLTGNGHLGERIGDTTDWQRSYVSSFFINARNNHVIGRFDLGYGIAVCKNQREVYFNTKDTSFSSPEYRDITLGGSFSVYYRCGNNFHIGLLYQPYFLSIHNNSTENKYEHTLTFDLMWRIKVN